jgi:hypothetical protein
MAVLLDDPVGAQLRRDGAVGQLLLLRRTV